MWNITGKLIFHHLIDSFYWATWETLVWKDSFFSTHTCTHTHTHTRLHPDTWYTHTHTHTHVYKITVLCCLSRRRPIFCTMYPCTQLIILTCWTEPDNNILVFRYQGYKMDDLLTSYISLMLTTMQKHQTLRRHWTMSSKPVMVNCWFVNTLHHVQQSNNIKHTKYVRWHPDAKSPRKKSDMLSQEYVSYSWHGVVGPSASVSFRLLCYLTLLHYASVCFDVKNQQLLKTARWYSVLGCVRGSNCTCW